MAQIIYSQLLDLALASDAVSGDCRCNRVPLTAWQALPMTLELDRFEEVGTLVDDPYDEPTFAEYHPHGTRYDSPDAPIAPRYYPCNLSQVARCRDCGRHYLRYNEAGGYFTELRIRALQARLLVDAERH
ncbi:hypothetical protein ASF61_09280 [Duganella sp. Leaf126]|uniref:hypothetical protein n=1 Tax=Duganella sp. Leaf126 TaxID=1736266 RepID=UPI0006F49108|nr:hypothetical protein [Duganella sp. Leaf126]KQQ33280.1 hypothetical protein ASF61_09280 [Duganella sp. Leaf126]